jgi:hypothetical protein
MADDFKKFKKMYKEGSVKTLANPPPMPGLAGAGGKAAQLAVGAAKKWGPVIAGTVAGAAAVDYLDKGADQLRAKLKTKKTNLASDKSRLNKGR